MKVFQLWFGAESGSNFHQKEPGGSSVLVLEQIYFSIGQESSRFRSTWVRTKGNPVTTCVGVYDAWVTSLVLSSYLCFALLEVCACLEPVWNLSGQGLKWWKNNELVLNLAPNQPWTLFGDKMATVWLKLKDKQSQGLPTKETIWYICFFYLLKQQFKPNS